MALGGKKNDRKQMIGMVVGSCYFPLLNKHKLTVSDFPSGSDGKASVYNAGDLGSIPGSGSSLAKEKATHSSTLA